MSIRIGDTVKSLKKLDEKKLALETQVSRWLLGETNDVTEFVRKAQLCAHNGCEQRQQKKFHILLGKKEHKTKVNETSVARQVMSSG